MGSKKRVICIKIPIEASIINIAFPFALPSPLKLDVLGSVEKMGTWNTIQIKTPHASCIMHG